MLSIVLAIIFGVIFTLIAVQNPGIVSLNLFNQIITLPTYLFAAFSFLVGIFVTLAFSLVDATSAALNLHQKDTKIKEVAKSNQSLQEHIQRLSNENTNLKQELKETKSQLRGEKIETVKHNAKNFFERIRHGFS